MRKRHQDDVRAKIQCNRLIVLLQAFAFGRAFQKKQVDLSPERLRAIEILLRKALPDLQSVEMTGPAGGPLEFKDVDPVTSARRIAFVLSRAVIERAKQTSEAAHG